jgi:hypothetical protein
MAKYFAVTEKISNFAPALEKAREIFERLPIWLSW